jgi:hypothetical protein
MRRNNTGRESYNSPDSSAPVRPPTPTKIPYHLHLPRRLLRLKVRPSRQARLDRINPSRSACRRSSCRPARCRPSLRRCCGVRRCRAFFRLPHGSKFGFESGDLAIGRPAQVEQFQLHAEQPACYSGRHRECQTHALLTPVPLSKLMAVGLCTSLDNGPRGFFVPKGVVSCCEAATRDSSQYDEHRQRTRAAHLLRRKRDDHLPSSEQLVMQCLYRSLGFLGRTWRTVQ